MNRLNLTPPLQAGLCATAGTALLWVGISSVNWWVLAVAVVLGVAAAVLFINGDPT